MINCLIVDDEPVARSIIRNYCEHLPFLNIVGECGNAFESKEKLAAGGVDLLFPDIHMPVISGIGFASILKDSPLVIFTTAYQEYAVNAFELSAVDYLLKPFSLERFIIAVDKAKEKLGRVAGPLIQQHLFIRSGGKLIKVAHHDCLFCEAQGNYTKVVTKEGVLQTKVSFTEFIGLLPEDMFIRVHHSFIINKYAFSHIEGNRVFIAAFEIPKCLHIHSSGGFHSKDPQSHADGYLKDIMSFFGVRDYKSIVVEGHQAAPDKAPEIISSAKAKFPEIIHWLS
jgi:DNA-binding LytR/AlgR family response regulator